MSGIFGLLNRSSLNPDLEVLRDMGNSMRHRGPDGIDIWHEGSVGIGSCSMYTTPEAVDKPLPYFDRERGLVVSADARLDARGELAARLSLSKQQILELSDQQLILAAYSKWQKKCVQHLSGDFSFLIWDRQRQELFCARDHLGAKPFYYYVSAQTFVVASEAQALLKAPQVPKTINESRIADFLVKRLEGIDHTSTFYESISRLPPAHTLTISKHKLMIERYWSLDLDNEVRYGSDAEYVEAFHELFKSSVNDRLRCNGQVTSMLSGGVDSSYTVGTARKILQAHGKELPVYSGVSSLGTCCRETHFINSVISQGGVAPTKIEPSDVVEFEQDLLSIRAPVEELFDAEMTLPMLFYLKARDRGQRVMLDGVEGDFVHSLGVSYPGSLLRTGRPIRAIRESIGIWRNTYGKQLPLGQTLLDTMQASIVPRQLTNFRRTYFPKLNRDRNLQGSLINREFASKIDIDSRLLQLASHHKNGDPVSLRESQIRNITHPYLTVALERYDRVAANCGVEPRHPLLDKRLVEFSVSLPWDQKVWQGWSKYSLRRASELVLPAEVAWRRGWDDICWSFTRELIMKNIDLMENQIKMQKEKLSRYIEPDALKRLTKDSRRFLQAGEEDSVWDVFRLANWLEYND